MNQRVPSSLVYLAVAAKTPEAHWPCVASIVCSNHVLYLYEDASDFMYFSMKVI